MMPPCRAAFAAALIILLCPFAAAQPNAELQELLGWVRALGFQARNAEALALCDMVLAEDPTNADALAQRGIIRLGQADYEAAGQDFAAALATRPEFALALVGRANAQQSLGNADGTRGDAAQAAAICTRAIEADSTDAMVYYVRGLARLLLGEQDEALQDFVTAGDLDDTLVEAHLERSHIYRQREQLDRALEALTHAVQVRPDYAVAYLARARVRFESKSFLGALDDCDRALQINPDFARAWHNRGLINLQIGDVPAAIDDLGRAIDSDPDYASAHFYRGEAYYRAGSIAAARAAWETARDVAPEEWAGRTAAEMLRKLDAGEL